MSKCEMKLKENEGKMKIQVLRWPGQQCSIQGRNYRDAADACALGPMASEGPGGQWEKKEKKTHEIKTFILKCPLG